MALHLHGLAARCINDDDDDDDDDGLRRRTEHRPPQPPSSLPTMDGGGAVCIVSRYAYTRIHNPTNAPHRTAPRSRTTLSETPQPDGRTKAAYQAPPPPPPPSPGWLLNCLPPGPHKKPSVPPASGGPKTQHTHTDTWPSLLASRSYLYVRRAMSWPAVY